MQKGPSEKHAFFYAGAAWPFWRLLRLGFFFSSLGASRNGNRYGRTAPIFFSCALFAGKKEASTTTERFFLRIFLNKSNLSRYKTLQKPGKPYLPPKSFLTEIFLLWPSFSFGKEKSFTGAECCMVYFFPNVRGESATKPP